MLLQGSQERALNEWPPSCYSVFMFSFLKTERKIERARAAAHCGGGAAAPVLQWRAFTILLTDYQAIHTTTSKYCTAAAARVRRTARARAEGTAPVGQLAQAQYVYCTLVCLLVSKRKLPALHLFVGTDAHIQFRQGLGLHFFLARKERERATVANNRYHF